MEDRNLKELIPPKDAGKHLIETEEDLKRLGRQKLTDYATYWKNSSRIAAGGSIQTADMEIGGIMFHRSRVYLGRATKLEALAKAAIGRP